MVLTIREGRAQQTLVAVSPPGMARNDWKILRALSEVAGTPLPYDTFDELRYRIEYIAPHLTHFGKLEPAGVSAILDQVAQTQCIDDTKIDIKLKELRDCFMTDVISRASPTMANEHAVETVDYFI